MANGFILSQEGVPVSTAADYQKVIDSRWKFLEVAYDTIVDVSYTNLLAHNTNGVTGGTLGTNLYTVINHNLGYVPYFEYEALPNTTAKLGTGIFAPNGSDWVVQNSLLDLYADTKNIYYSVGYTRQINSAPNTYTGIVRLNLRFKIFAIDIQQEYTAPTPASVAGTSYANTSLGVKILQGGSGTLGGDDPRAFATNTAYKTLSLQKTGTGVISSGSPSLVITHGAGYPPSFLITRLDTLADGTVVSEPGNKLLMRSQATSSTITFAGFQALNAGTYGYIILKDPLETAQ